MANEDTVLEEAMDNLKVAGQRIRATQGLMRSEGMTDCENYRDLPYASLYGARHDRSRILRGQASQGSLVVQVLPSASLGTSLVCLLFEPEELCCIPVALRTRRQDDS
jgi:hypothetical protein